MQFIKESKPYIEEIDRLRDFIFKKKHEKFEIGKPLQEMKEEITSMKQQINSLKKSQVELQESKEAIKKALDKINLDRNQVREQINGLRQQKDALREEFYKKLLNFEKQQIQIKDIEWMQGIKERVLEREEQKKLWEEEKAKRQEERKKRIEEAEKREEARRKRDEDRRKEEEDRQRKWEESQLQRLDVHPYTYEIELCEFLFKFCQKQDAILNGRLYENKMASDIQSKVAARKAALEQERREMEDKRKQAIQEALEKGKLARAEVVNEKKQKPAALQQTKDQPQPTQVKKTAPEEEDNSLNLDIGIL